MVDIDTIEANPEFRKRMLAVLLYSDWLPRYGAVVLPEYFPTKEEQDFIRWLNGYWQKYTAVPAMTYVMQQAADLCCDLVNVANDDLRYAADQMMDFCRAQAMKIAILQSVDDIKKGDLQTPLTRVGDALKVGADHKELGMELLADANQWVYEEIHGRKYPTGFPTVDHILDGGLVAGEYGIIMAPTGKGKTTILINIGYALAGLFSGTNVLHVTLELPVSKVLKRYAARATGVRLERGENFDTDERSFIAQLQKHAKSKMRGRVRVINPGNHISDIKRAIDNLSGEGFVTQALIVDYADLLLPPRKRSDERFELADITRDLRQLGTDYEIPVWSASQAGRHAAYKATVEVSDIAESIEKANVADVILSLSQTRDEEKLGTGRIFAAKVRDGQSNIWAEVNIDLKRQLVMEKHVLG